MSMFTLSSSRSLVDKATTEDDSPTPGFLYNDICKITFKSLKDCQVLEDYLLSRLTKKDVPIVKLKCLRVLKHCVLKGEISFKRDLQRRLGPIRACLDYRGAPDPIHGDAIYRQIREESQELMNALFDTDDGVRQRPEGMESPGNTISATATSISGFMPGFGSDSSDSSIKAWFGFKKNPSVGSGAQDVGFSESGVVTASGSISDSGNRFMEGMGNTSYNPHTEKNKKGKQGLLSKFFKAEESTPPSSNGALSNLSVGNFHGAYKSPEVGSALNTIGVSGDFKHVPGVPDGSWGSIDISDSRENEKRRERERAYYSAEEENYASPEEMHYHKPISVHQNANDQIDPGYVQELVDEVCAPGGVRVAPTAPVLSQFCLRVESLRLPQLAALCFHLNQKLDLQDTPQAQTRALYAIAALIKRKVEGVEQYFLENDHHITSLLSASQSTVRSKAREILQAIKHPAAASKQHSTGGAFSFMENASEGGAHSSEEPLFSGLAVKPANEASGTNSLLLDDGDPLGFLSSPSGGASPRISLHTSSIERQLIELDLGRNGAPPTHAQNSNTYSPPLASMSVPLSPSFSSATVVTASHKTEKRTSGGFMPQQSLNHIAPTAALPATSEKRTSGNFGNLGHTATGGDGAQTTEKRTSGNFGSIAYTSNVGGVVPQTTVYMPTTAAMSAVPIMYPSGAVFYSPYTTHHHVFMPSHHHQHTHTAAPSVQNGGPGSGSSSIINNKSNSSNSNNNKGNSNGFAFMDDDDNEDSFSFVKEEMRSNVLNNNNSSGSGGGGVKSKKCE